MASLPAEHPQTLMLLPGSAIACSPLRERIAAAKRLEGRSSLISTGAHAHGHAGAFLYLRRPPHSTHQRFAPAFSREFVAGSKLHSYPGMLFAMILASLAVGAELASAFCHPPGWAVGLLRPSACALEAGSRARLQLRPRCTPRTGLPLGYPCSPDCRTAIWRAGRLCLRAEAGSIGGGDDSREVGIGKRRLGSAGRRQGSAEGGRQGSASRRQGSGGRRGRQGSRGAGGRRRRQGTAGGADEDKVPELLVRATNPLQINEVGAAEVGRDGN